MEWKLMWKKLRWWGPQGNISSTDF